MISVVIPLLDEAATLEQLHRELVDVAERHGYALQIVLVDDGSTDGSWRIIQALAERDPRVEGIRLRRNFGKAAALSAGFDVAAGEVIVTMDADLQDSPAELPKLLAKLDEGYDVVSGWKQVRHDPWHKRWPSKAFNSIVGRLTGVRLHDHNCGLKCCRRDVIHEIRLYGELHRFIPVLAAARGFRVGETPVAHRPREFGVSKYGWSRIPKGLLDILTVQFITRFGHRPQHWLGTIGLASLLLGIAGMIYLAVVWCTSRLFGDQPVHLHETAALYYSLVAVLLGGQFLAIGFVAEMIAALVSRDRDEFSIAEHAGPTERVGGVPAPKSPFSPAPSQREPR
ncbi:MAG: glycosyltransferase family 2 protein [Pirellulales bacterium]|nr:glycosyltransferase family 2 protein [Pirellulales bacterium]